jgi:2-(1,2-epoxy-1,2-dihydrophenyl)acetyl-CoA isomerase
MGSEQDPTSPVVVETDGAVATVRLNRPQAMNALDVATKVALRMTRRCVVWC